MSNEEYEKSCTLIREANKGYLSIYEKYLIDHGLSTRTVSRHMNNLDYYLNDYLLRDDALSMEDGIEKIDDYFSHFFIRQPNGATPGTIKSTSDSIRKFYQCMVVNNKIDKDGFICVCKTIKDSLPGWQANCLQYNNQ